MDRARKYTDEELKKLERKLSSAYSSAQKELTKKWKEYMTYVNNQIKPYQAAYDAAVKSGLKTEIADAKAALDNIKRDLTLSSPRYNEMVDNLTDRMAHVNETALSYINDKVPNLYMANHNAIAPTAKSLGIDFTILNKNTLKNVTMARSLPLPKKLNIAKDKRWNAKKMNSSLLQGLLQGESMDKIAARMKPIVGGNQAAAIRSARTMVTQAENKGRLDSYHELEDMGTVMKKRWIATADEFTREEHLLMDGEEVDLDEPFSNGLMYPGDPDGDPGEVYNCRCSMETVILGFMDADGNINYVDESLHEDSGHHEQIEEEIERREDEANTNDGSDNDVDSFENYMMSLTTDEKLDYIFENDHKLAFEMEGKSDAEINEAVRNMIDNNSKVNIDGNIYGHIEKARIEYMNSRMIGSEIDKEYLKQYVNNFNSFSINSAIREGTVESLPQSLQDTITAMDKLIGQNVLDETVAVTRFADEKYLANLLGIEQDQAYFILGDDKLTEGIKSLAGSEVREKSFMSASTDVNASVFANYPVKINIIADKGTHAYITNNVTESEIIFKRGTKYSIEKVKVHKENGRKNRIEMIVRIING